MKLYRCTNDKCSKPVLFEGDFVGIVKKICPKCKQMIVFEHKKVDNLEKFCNKN